MDAGAMPQNSEELQRLLEKIYRERDFDLRGYKESVLTRRLGRRLRARGVSTYASYSRFLDRDPAEYNRLFDDLTIRVSSFFRDDAAFQALGEVVLPVLLDRGANNIRIWSAGCATGKEPYSIAILLLEMLGEEIAPPDGAILGTDVNERALEHAREGWYTPGDVEGISKVWLDKYFVHERGGFRIQPVVRRLVIFERHNLFSDQPYHDLELIVCRNVLIYFSPALQTQVLKNFCEGLKEGGFLLLGKVETPLGETRALFDCADSKAKLFRKVGLGQVSQVNSRIRFSLPHTTGGYPNKAQSVVIGE